MSGRTYNLEQPEAGERLRIRCDDPSGWRAVWAVDEELRATIVAHWRVEAQDLALWVDAINQASGEAAQVIGLALAGRWEPGAQFVRQGTGWAMVSGREVS